MYTDLYKLARNTQWNTYILDSFMQSYAIVSLLALSQDEFRTFISDHDIRADDAYSLPDRHNINKQDNEVFRRISVLCMLALCNAETFDLFRLDHEPINSIFITTLETAMARWRVHDAVPEYEFKAESIDMLTQSINMAAEFIFLSLV